MLQSRECLAALPQAVGPAVAIAKADHQLNSGQSIAVVVGAGGNYGTLSGGATAGGTSSLGPR